MSDPSVFSLEREILTLVERVEELERQMKIVWLVSEEDRERQDREYKAAQAERLRVNRWWATYNAAMPVFAAMPYVEDRHRACVKAADTAHGPLTPRE